MTTIEEEFRPCIDECNNKNPTKHKVTKSDTGQLQVIECLVCGSWMTIVR